MKGSEWKLRDFWDEKISLSRMSLKAFYFWERINLLLMLESLVVTILNKFLSDFIENLDSDQLNISLFSGDVQLENLTVRRTILDNMPLPFKLHYGRVGSIKVDVPVTAITSQPLKIDIQDIFVVLK